jgi:hypothetical protein
MEQQLSFINIDESIDIKKLIEFIEHHPKEYRIWKEYLKQQDVMMSIMKLNGEFIQYMSN